MAQNRAASDPWTAQAGARWAAVLVLLLCLALTGAAPPAGGGPAPGRMEPPGRPPGPYNPEDPTARPSPQPKELEPQVPSGEPTRPTPDQAGQPSTRPVSWPVGALEAVTRWLEDLGYTSATNSTGQEDWQAALERFRQAEGLPLGGPLKPEDLARLARRRFPYGCRLEVLVWPSGDPEAAASAPARDLVISADRPEALPANTLKLLLGYSENQEQDGYNPEWEATPSGDPVAGYWTRLSHACSAGCRLEVRLGPDEALARPAPAAKAVDLSLAEQVEGAYSHPARKFKPGDQVLAVEKVECSAKSGDWVLFYQGMVSEVGPQAVKVKLESRYSYRHRPDAQGVDPGDWWCVPRRRHCWSPVKFGDWGGQAAAGQIKEFRPQVVFFGQEGVVNIMSLVVSARCPN